ncbi:MAG: tRNA pseudouridine(55) synthase TruB [Saprospiraceae bacterium]|nr:tRNA pseudouridine(55) synthase TruB [Saprospiraceae bacterium]
MEDPLPSRRLVDGATLLVDKPQGWTSFDVVNKIRISLRHSLGLKNIKVGHAGTLDPMATGLLIICTGKNTKKLSEYQGQSKEYVGTITLGATTPSYDAESEPDAYFPVEHITQEAIEAARLSFMGDLEQLPPMFSAIKVDGQPLYKKARQGIMVEVAPRPVTIYEFDIHRVEMPLVDFRVKCSKGTYIRSLAFDFGKKLESGGYLTALRRTKIGEFSVENAWKIDALVEHIANLTPETGQ